MEIYGGGDAPALDKSVCFWSEKDCDYNPAYRLRGKRAGNYENGIYEVGGSFGSVGAAIGVWIPHVEDVVITGTDMLIQFSPEWGSDSFRYGNLRGGGGGGGGGGGTMYFTSYQISRQRITDHD